MAQSAAPPPGDFIPYSAAPSAPQPHPSSNNLSCPGGDEVGGSPSFYNHWLWWLDTVPCSTADVWWWKSWDASSLLLMQFAGDVRAGDINTLIYYTAAGDFTTQYTAQAGDTLAHIGVCLVDATLLGCDGGGNIGLKQVGYLFSQPVGGLPGQIFTVGSIGNPIALDWNSGVPMWLSFTSTGATMVAYRSVSGDAGCASSAKPCFVGLDTGPTLQTTRCAATYSTPACVVPGRGSVNFGFTVVGADSNGNANATYGVLSNVVLDNTAGAYLGQWVISAGNASAADALEVGNGICTASYGCMGPDTFHTGTFAAQGLLGVSCNGPPTATFTITGGIVTHC